MKIKNIQVKLKIQFQIRKIRNECQQFSKNIAYIWAFNLLVIRIQLLHIANIYFLIVMLIIFE
jgi:hypothetical protein